MSKAMIQIEGYLSNDPKSGQHGGDDWVSFSVPHTPRRLNKQSQQWEDAGDTLWVSVTLWRDDAQRFTDHLRKGTQVRVEGEPVLRAWESGGKSGVNLEVKFPRVSIVPPKVEQAPAASTDVWNTPQGGGNYGDDTPF
jgi:single-strand DNA-binding protein